MTSAVVYGISYNQGCCLCVGVPEIELPEFILVDAIYVDEANCIVAGTLLNCISYNEHFHAWLVAGGDSSSAAYCKVSNLVYPHPLNVHHPFGSFDSYVAPKFHLSTFSSCYCIGL